MKISLRIFGKEREAWGGGEREVKWMHEIVNDLWNEENIGNSRENLKISPQRRTHDYKGY